ncbi:MAG TPA: radical SAM protein [Candidatus Dormibacteraeota bacterium]|nr:radical SAM protein [Candidatus Dormibacteraeota bacterium]
MHVQRVVTNETCNQNCWFCNARRPAERPEFIARAAVRERIAAARAGDPREIMLTGGEPSMRSDLADLVQRAAADGGRVVLETNGALIDAARARALASAGLHTARVQLLAWDAEAADAISRVPGSFAAALDGIRALAAAGVVVEVTAPVVRRNHALLAVLPGGIVRAELPVAALILVIPTQAPDASECASLAEVAQAVTAVAESARRVGLALRLDRATYVPPCLFEVPERVTHLFALNRGHSGRGGFTRVAECESCLVNDRCPGLPQTAAPPPALHPIVEHRVRRRLTVMSTVEEQVARELVSRQIVRGGYGQVPEYTVRVNFHCNQACDFCFVSTHLPPAGDAAVRGAIEAAGREQGVLVLSGGEPTLNRRLLDYVRLAKQSGVRGIELQTNATRLGDAALARALVDAGIEQATVSLHASTAEISDAITGAPGTFVQTLRGLDVLAQLPVRVQLNFVFCQANRHDFPNVIELIAERWPKAGITPIFVGSHTDVVPRTSLLIPTFSDILPALTRGLARARAAGIFVGGLDTMCGLPLCLVPLSERDAFSAFALPPDAGDGEFVKGDACATCREGHRCYGVRRGYAELYGTGELRPFAAEQLSAVP